MTVLKKVPTKTTRSSPTSLHPPYLEMITEAITTMKDRAGSSQPSIAKYIEENYEAKHLPPNFRKTLTTQLNRFVTSEKLVKNKNSYKVPSVAKVKKPSESVKEKPTKKVKVNIPVPKVAIAKKSVEEVKKTKRLSQLKTPEALKKKTTKIDVVKRVDTPAAKRRTSSRTTPAKKAKN